MKNRYSILFLFVFFLGLSIYKIPFTYLDYKVQQKADKAAMDSNGNIDFKKRQEYLDSLWEGDAYKIFNKSISYKKIKSNALNWGLDLHGGISFVVEVDVDKLIINLAKKKYREQIKVLLESIQDEKKNDTKIFIDEVEKCFFNPTVSFSFVDCFENKDYGINIESSKNEDVKKYLVNKINSSLDKTLDVVKARIDKNGTTQPIINKIMGNRKIQIEIPGVHNSKPIKEMLNNVGELKFWINYDKSTHSAIIELLNKFAEKNNILNSKSQKIKFGEELIIDESDLNIVKKIFDAKEIKELLPDDLYICVKYLGNNNKEDDNEKKIKIFLLQTDNNGNAALSGDLIEDSRPTVDDRGKQAVLIKMNSLGTKLWTKITEENIGRIIVVTMDGKEIMSATINCKISRGETLISGNFSKDETRRIATILKTGSLPTPINIIEETIVGPGLNEQSQRQGLKSFMIAMIILLFLMFFLYSKSGLIINVALLFNVVFIIMGLAQINAVLTLPGIAGFILTLGMAIDANVLINERIKEELSIGKNIRESVMVGYKKASSAIIDSNITTFITALVLYLFGTGIIKGFAITLMIGLFFSFFTSVFLTRLILYIKEKNRRLKNMKFYFFNTSRFFKNININFIKLRKVVYFLSLAVIIVGCVCFLKSGGLKLGIYFTGGYNTLIQLTNRTNCQEITDLLEKELNEKVEIKKHGSDNVLEIFLQGKGVKDKQSLTNRIVDVLKNKYTSKNNVKIISSERVESSMAKDIVNNSRKSIFIVILCLFLYIFVRFMKWQYGCAAIITLIHDILMIFSVYAICRCLGYIIEVDEIFIAAILTIIGYAINNTVIIFDRLRENLKADNGFDLAYNINLSINNTLSRTLITSFTTIMVVLIIFTFGGHSLRNFSFITLIGLLIGTYSSIFISSPILRDICVCDDKKQCHY